MPMKKAPSNAPGTRFGGHLRHYHRSSTRGGPEKWEAWVEGAPKVDSRWSRFLKTAGVVVLLVLLGVAIGLVVVTWLGR